MLLNTRFSYLLSFYLALPVCLAIVVVDLVFLNGEVKSLLPYSPQSLLLFALFFGLPHIIASNQIFFTNKAYFTHFRTPFFKISLVIIGFLILTGTLFSYNLSYFLFAAVTVLHVLKQQFGLTKAVLRLKDKESRVWVSSGLLSGVAIYTVVFMNQVLSPNLIGMLTSLSYVTSLVFVISGLLLLKSHRSADKTAKQYLIANIALIPLSLLFYELGYSFFTILCPRLVHDLTAFYIYFTHNANKNHTTSDQAKNMPMTLAKTGVTTVFVAIAIAYIIQWGGKEWTVTLSQGAVSLQLATYVFLMVQTYLELLHYYTESITWKKGSPYRKYVRFI